MRATLNCLCEPEELYQIFIEIFQCFSSPHATSMKIALLFLASLSINYDLLLSTKHYLQLQHCFCVIEVSRSSSRIAQSPDNKNKTFDKAIERVIAFKKISSRCFVIDNARAIINQCFV